MSGISLLGLPERKRNYRFALTPLADAMFQLLIFFMLSSNLTPYSLLTLQSASITSEDVAQTDAQGGEAPPPQSEETPSSETQGETVLWTLEREALIVGGQSFPFDALERLAEALGRSGEPTQVVLIIRPSATVQDVTTVIARLQKAELTSVQIASGREG